MSLLGQLVTVLLLNSTSDYSELPKLGNFRTAQTGQLKVNCHRDTRWNWVQHLEAAGGAAAKLERERCQLWSSAGNRDCLKARPVLPIVWICQKLDWIQNLRTLQQIEMWIWHICNRPPSSWAVLWPKIDLLWWCSVATLNQIVGQVWSKFTLYIDFNLKMFTVQRFEFREFC